MFSSIGDILHWNIQLSDEQCVLADHLAPGRNHVWIGQLWRMGRPDFVQE